MTSPNTLPRDPITIEFDSWMGKSTRYKIRKTKTFTDEYKARSFWISKHKLGRNPKIISKRSH